MKQVKIVIEKLYENLRKYETFNNDIKKNDINSQEIYTSLYSKIIY